MKIRKRGFSLVELMVALIVVSCLTAAMAPVISKKLKSSGVTIAGATIKTSCKNIHENCELCSSKACLQCSIFCPAGQFLNTPDCTCKPCSSNCEQCKNENTCKKCFRGYKLDSSACSACPAGSYGDDGYNCSQCKKGEYQSQQGQSSCSLCEKGTYSNSPGATSCTVCEAGKYNNERGAVSCTTCEVNFACSGGFNHVQCQKNKGAVAGSTACTNCSTDNSCAECEVPGACQNCNSGFYMVSGVCKPCPVGAVCVGGLAGVSCAAGYYMESGVCKPCPVGATCTGGTSGIACIAGYYMHSGSCVACPAGSYCDGQSVSPCPAGKYSKAGASGCTPCPDGYYSDAGAAGCYKCAAGWWCSGASMGQCPAGQYSTAGSKACSKCWDNSTSTQGSGTCTCEDGYYLKDGKCNVASCGDLAMKITLAGGKALCMTKYNIGDKGLDIPSGIGIYRAKASVDTCTPSASNKCCWYDLTSNSCDTVNMGSDSYSCCWRTLCDWRAAKAICDNLKYNNRTWRLPTSAEWKSIGSQLNSISIGQGEKGLRLCNQNEGYGSGFGAAQEKCLGSSHNCHPFDVWTSTGSYFLFSGNNFREGSDGLDYPFSVRCVSDF